MALVSIFPHFLTFKYWHTQSLVLGLLSSGNTPSPPPSVISPSLTALNTSYTLTISQFLAGGSLLIPHMQFPTQHFHLDS